MNTHTLLDAARQAYRRAQFLEAGVLYARVAEDNQLDTLATFRFATCSLIASDLGGAIGVLERGLVQWPDDSGLTMLLGCAREIEGREAVAAKLYRAVIASTPSAGPAYANLAYLMCLRGNDAGAAHCLGRGLEAIPTYLAPSLVLPTFRADALPKPTGAPDLLASNVCLLLGLKLQEVGRFEQARICFTQSLRFDRRNGPAYGALALCAKVTKEDTSLVDLMSEVSKQRDLDQSTRSRLHFALGKAMDDLGEYQNAIAHVDEGHRIAIESGAKPFDRLAFKKNVDGIIDSYPNLESQEVKADAVQSELPLLIVGMMRSGTSLVEQIISSHPEVGAGDELAFWSEHGFRQLYTGVRPPTPQESVELADAYTSLLREIDPDALRVTDKMPLNYMAIGLVHRVLPNARIVCCRRNPVDVCLSIYMTDFRHPIPYANRRDDLVFFHREFERIMDHWRDAIPSDRLLEVRYEELLANREQETRRLIDFCGLKWDDACLHPEANLRPVKTASVWQVRQGVYSSSQKRWRRYEPWLGELRSLLPENSD